MGNFFRTFFRWLLFGGLSTGWGVFHLLVHFKASWFPPIWHRIGDLDLIRSLLDMVGIETPAILHFLGSAYGGLLFCAVGVAGIPLAIRKDKGKHTPPSVIFTGWAISLVAGVYIAVAVGLSLFAQQLIHAPKAALAGLQPAWVQRGSTSQTIEEIFGLMSGKTTLQATPIFNPLMGFRMKVDGVIFNTSAGDTTTALYLSVDGGTVACVFSASWNDRLAKLNTGQHVEVTGIISELMNANYIGLVNCSLEV